MAAVAIRPLLASAPPLKHPRRPAAAAACQVGRRAEADLRVAPGAFPAAPPAAAARAGVREASPAVRLAAVDQKAAPEASPAVRLAPVGRAVEADASPMWGA
ncbi:hypothetical protein OKHIF_40110 [Mycobacteroides chelonae]